MYVVATDLKLFLSNLLKILVFFPGLTMFHVFYSVFFNFHELVVRCLSKFLRLAWSWTFLFTLVANFSCLPAQH